MKQGASEALALPDMLEVEVSNAHPHLLARHQSVLHLLNRSLLLSVQMFGYPPGLGALILRRGEMSRACAPHAGVRCCLQAVPTVTPSASHSFCFVFHAWCCIGASACPHGVSLSFRTSCNHCFYSCTSSSSMWLRYSRCRDGIRVSCLSVCASGLLQALLSVAFTDRHH